MFRIHIYKEFLDMLLEKIKPYDHDSCDSIFGY